VSQICPHAHTNDKFGGTNIPKLERPNIPNLSFHIISIQRLQRKKEKREEKKKKRKKKKIKKKKRSLKF